MFKNVRHWHDHKHASVLAIGQLRRQSATAPSYATCTGDLSQLINVMNFGTNIAECLQRTFIPVFRYVKYTKIHQDVPEL